MRIDYTNVPSLSAVWNMYLKVDDAAYKAWWNVEPAPWSLRSPAVLLLDSSVLVSEPEPCCLLGWPFCLLSCVDDGRPVSRDVVYLPSFISPSMVSPLPPHPLTPSLPFDELPPLLSTVRSHPPHLSPSLHLCLSLSFTPLLSLLQSSHFQPKG